MSPNDLTELTRIASRLNDQDERYTVDVAYHVQRRTRFVSLDMENSESTIWVQDGEEVPEHWAPLLFKADAEDHATIELDDKTYEMDAFEKWGATYGWQTDQVCLTEEGAERYLKANAHNMSRYGAPRIYGESFYRNEEMRTLRRILPELAVQQNAVTKLIAASNALIERWETPLWKDVPATAQYIADLRAALGGFP